MVASVLVAIGISSAVRGFAALTKAQSTMQERDRMQRLAVSKYDELLAQGINNASTSGDFQEYNDDRYKWVADIENTTTTNLQSVKVTVSAVDPTDTNQASIDGLVFSPQTSVTPGAANTGAGG